MKRTLTFFTLFFAALCAYAYVGETFIHEGVRYTVIIEDNQTGTYEIDVSHYDTTTAIIPDAILHNGHYYQVTTENDINSTTNFFYPQNCSLHHYSKIDYSQVKYPNSLCWFITSDSVEVDTLILPPHCPYLCISSVGNPAPNAPTGGIHRIFLSGTQQPLNKVLNMSALQYSDGFGLELQEIDLSSYPYTAIPFTFKDCSNLQRVTLPQTVQTFQSNLFWGNTSLQELTFPNDLEEIHANAFGNLAFDFLTISDKVRLLHPGFATSWYRLRNIFVDDNNPYYTDIDGVLFTKNGRTTRHYPVARPDTTYFIPLQVDTIGGGTFALEYFDYASFGFNNMHVNFYIQHNIDFQSKAPLNEVRIHSGVSTIATGAFSFSSIRRLTSGEKKEQNENFSFSNVHTIEAGAFAGSLLDSVSLPPSLRYLGSKESCRRWLWNDTTIGFNDWDSDHRNDVYGTNLLLILTQELLWKEELNHPNIHFTTWTTGDVFAMCQHLQKVDFSKCRQLSFIGGGTFAYCPRLTSLDLSPCDSIVHIPYYFCEGASALSYVHLPYRVDTIDPAAFRNCVSLDTFVCPAPVPIHIKFTVFEGVNKQTCTLMVPDASIPLYEKAPIWKEFYHIVGNGLKAIAVTSADSTMGMVRGGAGLHVGDSTVIRAIPFEGFEFAGWSDGNTDNPRMIHVTQDSNLVANFRYINYVINAYPSDSTLGAVTGGGLYHLHEQVFLEATPFANGKFTHWSDGYRYSVRDWVVTGDTILIANFEHYAAGPNVCRVRVQSEAPEKGTTRGSGNYALGDTAAIAAVANAGYVFKGWDDGNIKNPRLVPLTRDTMFIALFRLETDMTDTMVTPRYVLNAIPYDSTMGTVSGSGRYEEGTVIAITATPFDGYRVKGWNIEVTDDSVLVFTMPDHRATVIAYFEALHDALPAVPASEETDDVPYNVLGQPVDENYKGIVIKNGKKKVQ